MILMFFNQNKQSTFPELLTCFKNTTYLTFSSLKYTQINKKDWNIGT